MKEAIVKILEENTWVELKIDSLNIMKMSGRYYVFPNDTNSKEGYDTALQAAEAFMLARDLIRG